MNSYYLTFFPKLFPGQEVFKTLLEAIPPGKFYLLAPITVPYSPLPQTFILYTDAWGQVITIDVNGKEQARLIPLDGARSRQILANPSDPQGFHVEVEVPLTLDMGTNSLHVEIDNGQAFDLLVVANPIASLYKAYASSLFDNLLYPLQQQQDSLMSPWSPELMESLLRFRSILPDLRIPKTHAIKLAVRAMMAHSGTNLGVQAFATALSYNNPFIVQSTSKDFLSLDYNLALWQDEVAGSEFHMWLPSKAEVGWLAFSRLIYNLPQVFGVEKITEAEDIFRDLLAQNRQEQHQFTFLNTGGPDFDEIIREIPTMKLGQHTTRKVTKCIGFYNYRYPLGLKVLYPLGDHILGRREKHLGPIDARVNFGGGITPTTERVDVIESVTSGWGVNPPVGNDRVNSVLLTDDTDLSYIYSPTGVVGTPDPVTSGSYDGPIQTFRVNCEDIPGDAINITAQVVVSSRSVGMRPGESLRVFVVSGGVTSTLSTWVPPAAYSSTTSPSHSFSSRDQLSSAMFGVSTVSPSQLPSTALVRVTEFYVLVTYSTPVRLEVMGIVFSSKLASATNSQVVQDLGSQIEDVKDLLELDVTYMPGPSPTWFHLHYRPILDINGKVLTIKKVQAPNTISITVDNMEGRRLGTNDGVDLWSAYDHDEITIFYTDPATRLVTPKTFTPEIGFLGHSLTSTRMSGWKQQGISAQWGTMSGFYPSSRNLGVGSVDGATKQFTFPQYTFTAGDVGKSLVVTRSTQAGNTKTSTITSIISPHVAACASAVVTTDSSISAKLIYKCGERRPVRVRGPQARLLSESRVVYRTQPNVVEAISIYDSVVIDITDGIPV